MFKLLGCAQGHFWEADDRDSPRPVCPVCGAASNAEPFGPDLAPSDAPLEEPQTAPPPPLPLFDRGRPVVAGYEILDEQGRGPTGVLIYKARQVLINRLVTLKVVVARDDPGQLAWGGLRGEASALGRLHHPNIVALLEAGERDRQLFFNVLEFVDGPTLAKQVDGKPLPPIQAAALIEILARAVEAAHQQDLVHRCLKPASVLLRPVRVVAAGRSATLDKDAAGRSATLDKEAGRSATLDKNVSDRDIPPGACQLHKEWFVPKLTDFGLTRRPLEGETADIELQGAMPSYLAPEQAAGRIKDIGPTTDVYALGAIFYELLTGRPPFRGSTPGATVAQIQNAELVPPAKLRPLPGDLDAICRKALHHSPRRRYPSAAALAEELPRYRVGLPVEARPTGAVRKLGLWMARNRMATGLIASVVLALFTFLSALIYGALADTAAGARIRDQQQRALSTQQELERKIAGLQLAGGERTLDQQRLESYRYALQLRRVEEAPRSDERNDALEACPVAQRHWEYRYLSALARGDKLLRSLEGGSLVKALAFSPDVRYLAIVGGELAEPGGGAGQDSGALRLYNLQSGRLLPTQQTDNTLWDVAFSPDSTQLATATSGQFRSGLLQVWSLANREKPTEQVQQGFDEPLTSVAFFPAPSPIQPPGGQRLAVRTVRNRVITFKNLRNTNTLTQAEEYPGQENEPSPGRVVTLGDNGVIAWSGGARTGVRLASDLASVRTLPGADIWNVFRTLAASPDGRYLAAGTSLAQKDGIRVWMAPWTDNPLVLQSPSSDLVTALAFSPDGRRLFSTFGDGTLRVWDPLIGQELLRLNLKDFRPAQGAAKAPTALAVSRDAEYVAVALEGEVYLIGPLPRGR